MTEVETGLSSGNDDFDVFYRAEYAAVVRLAYALTGRRDLAEELAQDGFLAAHRRWSSLSRYEQPGGWVRRVVTNRCVSTVRRHATELRLVARLGRERVADVEGQAVDDDLWAFVRRLPRRQAQVLVLSFLEDRSVGDIALLLGCGEESVRTHLRRGRHALARQLKTEDDHE